MLMILNFSSFMIYWEVKNIKKKGSCGGGWDGEDTDGKGKREFMISRTTPNTALL